MTQHAIIAPSSLDRIVACPGSVYLSSLMPAQPERPEATEGDAAHWVAMRIALGEVVKKGETAPNGVLVDSEMIEGGETYADALDYLPGIAEKTVTITAIHHSQCFGTPDFFQYAPNTHTLRVTDYKYGFRFVEVYENWQLMAYASGVMEFLGLSDEGLKLDLLLVQPRSYHRDGPVRSWKPQAVALRPYINRAHGAAGEALGSGGAPNPDALTHSGPHCLDCPARAVCKTLHAATTSIVDWTFRAEAMPLDASDAGRRLKLIDDAELRLKAIRTGLKEQVYAMLARGERVPFYALHQKKGRQAWTVPASELAVLDETLALGGALTELAPAVTPKQAIKLGVDKELVEAYSHTPSGGLTVEADSMATTSRIFSK